MDFPQRDMTFPEEIYDGRDIDTFYRCLTQGWWATLIEGITLKVRDVLLMTEKIHYLDKRKSGIAYMYHLVEVTQWVIDRWEHISPNAIMTRMLHDSLEDHPEYWREVLALVWVQLFRDVLVLATGGLKERRYREEMILYFTNELENQDKSDSDYDSLVDIIHILSPVNPFRKAISDSRYANLPRSQIDKIQRILGAISLYRSEIIFPECRNEAELRLLNKIRKMERENEVYTLISNAALLDELSNTPLSKEEKNEKYDKEYRESIIHANWSFLEILTEKIISEDEEYIWLWNYLFFTEYNCKDKVEDMINNTKDLTEMEQSKPWYARKRLIKAYILWVKLLNFWLDHETRLLEEAFWKHGLKMLTSEEVKKFTQKVHSESH